MIVVGAGVAGSSTAIRAAQKGLSVLLVDRGDPIGSKNLSGGVLWGNDLAHILGENWYEEAPLERHVVRKGVGFLAPEDSTVIDLRFPSWGQPPYNGHSVLRARLDPWLAKKAEEAGVEVYAGINIQELLIDDTNPKKRQIQGIVQNGDEFRSKVVIFAEGATSRLLLDHGFKPEKKRNVSPLEKEHFMLGVKEIIRLPQETLEDRFNLTNEHEGAAYEIVSGVHDGGARVGGFLYTNKDTVSLGVVIQLETVTEQMHTYQLYEEYKAHPWIQALIRGGERVEYGAHLVPHGGYSALPKLYHGGGLLVGDAATFLLSNGLSINGMNYAIASGIVAADTAKQAIERGDVTEKGLSLYKKNLGRTYFYKDMKKFKKVHKVMSLKRMFKEYPAFMGDIFKEILTENGWQSTGKKVYQKPKVRQALFRAMKKNKINRFKAAWDALNFRHI